jgi:hypothetical protein
MNTKLTHKCQEDLHSEDKNKEGFQNYHSCLMDDMMNMTDLAHCIDSYRELDGPITRSKARRASSFHGCEWAFRNHSFRSKPETDVMKSSSYVDISETIMQNSLSLEGNAHDNRTEQQKENDEWKTADVFFSDVQNIKEEAPVTGRASVAKLRSQNAGMVLERMKLFDAKANCNVRQREKKKSMIDSKAKGLVHVPSVFARHADVIQSLKGAPAKKNNISRSSHSKSVQRIHSPLLAKSGIDDLQFTFKDSPKKIGTPRRKHGMKSPNGSHRKERLKVVKLPSRVDLVSAESPASAIRKKHSSMKLARERVCTDMKANLTVPVIWLSTEKENVLSPSDNTYVQPNLSSQRGMDLKEEPWYQSSQASVSDTCKEVCSPAVSKTSVSPLKDCNRIEINSQIPHLTGEDTSVVASSVYRTPRETPYIKKALLTKSPSQFCKTPQNNPLFTNKNGRRLQTPVKAVVAFGSETPLESPGRQSPRLLSLNLRNVS